MRKRPLTVTGSNKLKTELSEWVEWNSGRSGEICLGKEEERMKGWDANFIGLVLESGGSCSFF